MRTEEIEQSIIIMPFSRVCVCSVPFRSFVPRSLPRLQWIAIALPWLESKVGCGAIYASWGGACPKQIRVVIAVLLLVAQ